MAKVYRIFSYLTIVSGIIHIGFTPLFYISFSVNAIWLSLPIENENDIPLEMRTGKKVNVLTMDS